MISFRESHYLIHWWLGTDALKLDTFPPTDRKAWYIRIVFERIFHKLIEPFIREHWIVGEPLRKHLLNFGIDSLKIKLVPLAGKYGRMPKQDHKEFNVLYYFPKHSQNAKFKEWKYGWDLFVKIRKKVSSDINFIVVDGTQDLTQILPIVDCYIRPSRHDGLPRLVLECQENDIPVYYPFGFGIEPSVEDAVDFILKVKERSRKWEK